jgi:hypothetical protein
MTKARKVNSIYISYARRDASKVDFILKNLVARGYIKEGDRILKEDLLPQKHRSLREGVKRTIQLASKVVVLWDAASASSQWVNYEIGIADALEKPIIAVVQKKSGIALPLNLRHVQVVSLIDDDSLTEK